jgi:malonyl-CoA O-methyltransferase
MTILNAVYNVGEIAASFNRAASQYDQYAFFQREIVTRVLARLEFIQLVPQRILDLGAGTGYAHAGLVQRYPKTEIVALDLATAMLAQNTVAHYAVCGDSHHLPLQTNSVDMVFSSLMLHWCSDLGQAFSEVKRVLKPGGLFIFATLGPDTLTELRQAWSQVDEGKHVHDYMDMHDVGDVLLQQGLADPVMDMECVSVEYEAVMTLMQDIKHIGGHNMDARRQKTLTPPSKLRKLLQAYEAFRLPNGQYPLTYEVVYGHAWGPTQTMQDSSLPEIEIPLEIPLASLRSKR